MDTLLQQSGVSPEQAASFRQYAQALISQNADLSDAGAIGRELQTALHTAEGLEQAAAGLERILANPAEITDAIFREGGVEAGSVQEGIAELQRRVTDLGRRAQQYRVFYQDPAMIERVRQADRLAQDAGQRGDVTLTPEVNVVRLFNGRQDRSTFMHEAFHIYNRYLTDAADKADASEQTRADYQALNEAVDGGLASSDPEVRREAEERAAEMFEKYLSEGKAPTPFLHDAFRRFRSWLTSIYRQVAGFGETDLSDDVRGVFDRMIAAESEIEYARQFYNDIDNLAPPADSSGTVKADLASRASRARASAEERHINRMVREYFQAAGGRKAYRNMAREQVAGERVYRAERAIREAGGMTREQIANEIGDAMAAKATESHRGILAKSAPSPDQAILVADELGYESVRNMLSDLAQAPRRSDAVTAVANQLIAAEEARIRRIAAEDAATPADEDYHNDAYSDYFAAKQRALDSLAAEQAEKEGRRAQRMMTNRAIRAIAAYNASQKTGRKAGQYHVEVQSFKRHSSSAMAAEKKGDYIAAAKEWRMMRIAHHGIREAIEARHNLRRFEERHTHPLEVVRRLEGRSHSKTAPVEAKFRETIKDMSTTWKVTDSHSMRPAGRVGERIAIPGVDPNLSPEAAAMLPALAKVVPQWIVNREGADKIRSWRDLRMEQIDELGEALNSLEKLGQGMLQALRQPGIETREQLKRESMRRIETRQDRSKVHGKPGENDTLRNKLLRRWEKLGVDNFIPEYILAMADGNTNITGGGIGPLQNLALTLRDGLSRKGNLANATMEKIRPAYRTLQEYRKRFHNLDKSRLGELPEGLKAAYGFNEWSAEMAIAIAWNSGNAGNLKAIMDGYGISEEQWRGIMSTFTAAELNAVQDIWNAIGEYFPKIDEVTFRLTNKNVRRVEAQPLTVVAADGEATLDGGYFPLVYDGLVDGDLGAAQDIEMSMNKAHYDAIHTLARMADSFTMARLVDEEGSPVTRRPPKLELDVLTTHIDKVAHYVALAEAVHEADMLTVDGDWEKMFASRFGQAQYNSIRNWLKYVADPDSGNKANDTAWGRSLNWMRRASTTAALGLRFWSAMKQRLDYFPAALHLSLHSRTGASGFKYLIKGMRGIGWRGNLGLMSDRIQEIYGKSAFMKNRDGNVTLEMREMTDRTIGKEKVYNVAGIEFGRSDIYNFAFSFMSMQDRAAASAVWLGAYQMALDGNGSFDSSGMSPEQLDAAAIRDADAAAATFASTTAADLTQVQRDRGTMHLFTSFITGTIRRTSRLRQYADAVRQGQMSKSQFLQAFVLDAALQAWVPGFMYLGMKAMTGSDDDEPSAWDWLSTIFMDPVLTFIDGIPGFNAFGSMINYGPRGAFTPAAIGEFEKQAVKLWGVPKNLAKDEYGKAAWKLATFGSYAGNIPLERPVRDAKKALQAVGAVEKDD